MQRYPLKRLAFQSVLCFIVGIFVAKQFNITTGSVAVLLLCLIPAGFFLQRVRGCRRCLVFLLAFCLGAVFFLHHHTPSAQLAQWTETGNNHRFQGTVLTAPEGKSWLHLSVTRVDDRVLAQPAVVRVLKTYGDETVYERAAVVSFEGKPLKPEGRRNPGGFNEQTYLFSKGILVKLDAASPGTTIAPAAGFQKQVNLWQASIDGILSHRLSPAHEQLTRAVLFGETGGLHDDFYSLSQRLGIIHIFSVSGLHVGFIVAFIMGIAVLLKRQNSWMTFFFLLPLLAIYIVLSGLSPPAMRAGLMAILGLLAFRLLRYSDLLTILAISAAVLLSANPHMLWDIGFQLSFLITGGIVYGYPAVRALFPSALPARFSDAVALSLTAELVSAPLVAWYFYMFAPFSILMNLLVVPLFSLLVPLALLAIALGLALPLAAPLLFLPVHIILYVVIAMMQVFDAIFGSGHIYIGQPAPAILLAYALVLWLFFTGKVFRAYGTRHHRLVFAAVLLLLVFFHNPVPKNQVLTVLDVGQGSSAVMQAAPQKWFVFDTGMPKDTTAQFMRYAAANQIEGVVLSHSDADHISGLAHLLRDFRVKHVFISPTTLESEPWQTLSPVLERKDAQVHVVEDDLAIRIGASNLHLVNLHQHGEANNAAQLVANVQTPTDTFLFPGDASADAMLRLTDFQKPDVVLVPHHGSKNSWVSSYYAETLPQLAVVSCGKNNRFGHPHAEVIDGLQHFNIPVLRTDETGAVCLLRERSGIRVETTATSAPHSP